MIKVDLHIHTVNTITDHDFEFSMDTLVKYVENQKLDCIAITNHNLFDIEQFYEIKKALKISVFPGIEINLGKGHILLISNDDEVEDFNTKCARITGMIQNGCSSISLAELKNVFTDLSKYLLIPHLDKSPEVEPAILSDLSDFVTCGEVSSVKKFIYQKKKDNTLVPVIFSDSRMKIELDEFPVKQTYLETDDVKFNALRYCLRDKNKTHLAFKEDHFQIFENGQQLSLGLNVVFGERSSGKTVFLNSVYKQMEDVKYIKQFQLLERDEETSKKAFSDMLSADQDKVAKEYLFQFEKIIDDVIDIDLKQNEEDLIAFLDSLMKAAREKENQDAFSKSVLFRESLFTPEKLEGLEELISSVQYLIDNSEYRTVIVKHIDIQILKNLIIELIETYREKYEKNSMVNWLNDIIRSTKMALQSRSAATVIKEFNLENYISAKKTVSKFDEIVGLIRKPKIITSNSIQGFVIVAETSNFQGAQELGSVLGRKASFASAFASYNKPYMYLMELKKIDMLPKTEIYRYFVKINYKILNKHGLPVSGGERSEFNLLREIKDALHHNLLLIDEPESSFDNLFLKNSVNKLLRDISEIIPVVIVTHNSTIGASIEPNYLIYTRRENNEGTPMFKVYSGLPTDKELVTTEGEKIQNYSSLIDSLEAGEKPYLDRSRTYETLKN
jgi:ABC-type lipopolysaccharide export system ATPase subunit